MSNQRAKHIKKPLASAASRDTMRDDGSLEARIRAIVREELKASFEQQRRVFLSAADALQRESSRV